MKVYSTWQIRFIVMAVSLLYIVPLFYAITYTYSIRFDGFGLSRGTVSIGVLLAVAMIFSLILWRKFSVWHRAIKIEYRKEFSYLLLVSGFGFLGLIVMFVEFGGDAQYVIHLLIGLFIVNYIFVTVLGRKLFNVTLIGKDNQ